MGIFLTKIYFKYSNQINNDLKQTKIIFEDNKTSIEERNIIKDIKYQESIPNPLFINQKLITDKHKISQGMDLKNRHCYEIYKLKNINTSINIAFQNFENNIDILKYDFSTFEKILTINITPRLIKYFYDEIENKEYLIIQTLVEIHIFLIINEKEYLNIFSYQEEGCISRGTGCCFSRLPINGFTIFYDKYENINFLIISFFYKADCTGYGRKISILKFINNHLIKVKEIKPYGSEHKIIFLIWENKKSKSYNLIYNDYNYLKLIEINDKKNEEVLTNNNNLEDYDDYFGCIINNKNGKDFLYLFSYSGTLIIFDLYVKQIIKRINIINKIESIVKWNNNYIILATKKYIYTFDIINQKIINKKSFKLKYDIYFINKYFFDDLKLYYLCMSTSDNKLRILY